MILLDLYMHLKSEEENDEDKRGMICRKQILFNFFHK